MSPRKTAPKKTVTIEGQRPVEAVSVEPVGGARPMSGSEVEEIAVMIHDLKGLKGIGTGDKIVVDDVIARLRALRA